MALIQVDLPDILAERLRQYTFNMKSTKKDVVRDAIKEYLDKKEQVCKS